MKQYWPCAIVLKKNYLTNEYTEGKQYTYDSCLSLNDAIRVIRVWQQDMIIKEAWIDVYEGGSTYKISLTWNLKNELSETFKLSGTVTDDELLIYTDDIDLKAINKVIIQKIPNEDDRLVVKRVFSV